MSGSVKTLAQLLAEFASGQAAGSITAASEQDLIATMASWSGGQTIYTNAPPYSIITDGTTDQTSVLQAALTAAATKGATVVLPLGPVVINATGVTVPDGVSLVGQGNQNKFELVSTNGSWIISPSASYSAGTNAIITLGGHNTLRSFAIFGAGSGGFGAATSRPNILMTGPGICTLWNISSLNGWAGVYCNYVGVIMATDCEFSANQFGAANPVDSHFTGCYFSSNGCDLLLQSGSASNMWSNCRFEFGGGPGASVSAGFGATDYFVNTSATTASGTTLTFASTAAITAGHQVFNFNAPASIPAGTYVASKTGTTVTLSNAVASSVASGNTIEFYLGNTDFNNFTGCQWDRSFTNALNMALCRHWVITGCSFRRCGAGATANTNDDAAVRMAKNNAIVFVGNTIWPGKDDSNSGPNCPSWGVWDDGGNFLCILKNNSIVYNPVNGTNGGGINITTNFTTFNTDNSISVGNPLQVQFP